MSSNPKSQKSSRRLAAILFVDISGYTALMQKDEAAAAVILRKFQGEIESKVKDFSGHIANEMGDGMLCVFDAPNDAVRCAMKLKVVFEEEPVVPVRLGVHSGTVVFDGGKVYGDSINVAARIESMGVIGAVLISDSIRRNIKNQADLEVTSLGSFDFKNVDEPMEVFAISNEGFVVPDRKDLKGKFAPKSGKILSKRTLLLSLLVLGILLLFTDKVRDQIENITGLSISSSEMTAEDNIKTKRVAVLPFDDQTNSEDLAQFGLWASDHLASNLMKLEDVKVASYNNVQKNISLASIGNLTNSNFARATGAEVVVQGRYYLEGENLIVYATLVNGASGDLLYTFDGIEGNRKDLRKVLEEVTQRIIGFWEVNEIKKFDKRPPRYDAYLHYKKGNELRFKDPPKSEEHYLKALELDSTFYKVYFKLFWLYAQTNLDRSLDSLDQIVTQYEMELNPWEKARLDAQRAALNLDRIEWVRANYELYKIDPFDGASKNQAAYSQLYSANNPKKAIEIIISNNPNHNKVGLILPNYALGMYDSIRTAIELQPTKRSTRSLEYIATHMKTLVRLQDEENIEKYLDYYMGINIRGIGISGSGAPWVIYWVCSEADITDQIDLKSKYAKKLLKWSLESNDARASYFEGMAYYWLGDYKKAISAFQNDTKESFGHINVDNLIPICLALIGDENEAIKYLEEHSDDLPKPSKSKRHADIYASAQINAAMGNIEDAVVNIEKYVDHAFGPYFYVRMKNDHLLKPLLGHPRYEELLKPIE